MPFLEERPRVQNLTNFAEPDQPVLDPSLAETFGAAFRTQNVVGSFLSSRGDADPYAIEPGFDAIDYVKDDPKYAPYVDEFAGIFNKRSAEAKKLQIQREVEDRITLDAAGGMGVAAQMAAGVFDLPTLLPFGAVIGGGRTAAVAGRAALGAGLDAAASEAALQGTQATRTAAETVLNIGGSIILGGALGALVGRYMTSASAATMSRKIEAQEQEFAAFDKAFASSVGAAAKDTGPLKLKDEALISKLPLVNRQDPMIRLQLGQLDTGRQTVRQLAETPLEYADNAMGVATEKGGSVETRMKMWNAPLYRATREIDTHFARYFHSTPDPSSWRRRLSPTMSEFDRWRGGQKMTYKQFKEEVGRAAYMGGQHEIPEVASAAKVYRQLDDELKQAAIEARIPGFTDDMQVAGDVSHRFRMYDKQKIVADRGNFARILQDYFITKRDELARMEAKVAKSADAKPTKEAIEAEKFARMTDGELKSVVDEVIDTILGHADGRIPYDIVAGPRGALKERVLKIETAKIHGFVENDIEQVMRSQIRTMSADIEISKKFGSVDMAEEIRKVNDEANAKIATAKTQKERQALEKARKDTIRDIEGIRDRLRGTYRLPADPSSLVLRAGRVARNINYVRLLGGMTISAVPDMAKVVFTHGLVSTFRDGFIPMVRNFKAFRLAGEEVKSAGTALDMVLDSRTMAMADIVDEFGHHSKFERGLSAISSKFGVVSLMAPWNAAMKQFSGLVTMTNVLKTAERVAGGKGTQKDISRLAASGIDADLAGRIAKQFAEHGDEQDGILLAKAGDWKDKGAREAFRAAVVRDVDRIIVTPGQDKPLWMSTELGKTVGQFKSFAVSSMQKTTLAGLQQRDAATLNGLLLMMGLGATAYHLKQNLAGRETSDDPSVWAVEAFDKSGIAGWLMEANNIAEKASRGKVGLSAFTGEQVSRYATRNVTGAFLGPSADAISDIFQVSGSVFAGDTTKSDLRKARQLLPGQNIFYIRELLNQVEAATGDALGLPDTRKN